MVNKFIWSVFPAILMTCLLSACAYLPWSDCHDYDAD